MSTELRELRIKTTEIFCPREIPICMVLRDMIIGDNGTWRCSFARSYAKLFFVHRSWRHYFICTEAVAGWKSGFLVAVTCDILLLPAIIRDDIVNDRSRNCGPWSVWVGSCLPHPERLKREIFSKSNYAICRQPTLDDDSILLFKTLNWDIVTRKSFIIEGTADAKKTIFGKRDWVSLAA